MSASREKKLRKDGLAANQNNNGEKKSAAGAGKRILIAIGVIVLVAVIGFFSLVSSGFFTRHATAATVGNHKITPVEFNYFYKDTYTEVMNSYGDMASSLLDTTKPLDEQIADATTGETWADFFVNQTLTTIASDYAIYDAAMAAGYTPTADDQAAVDSNIAYLELYASSSGYSVDGYISMVYGKGCKLSTYEDYAMMQQIVASYSTQYQTSLTFTEDEIDTYYSEHTDDFDTVRYRSFYLSTTPPEESTEDAETYATSCKETVDAMALDSYQNEQAFIDLAYENAPASTQSSYADDSYTLRESSISSVSSALAPWLTDSARAEGDTTVIANEADDGTVGGYYVLYYLSKSDNDFPMVNVRHILITPETDDEAGMTAAQEKADAILAEFNAGDQTEDAFAELAVTNSADSNAQDGGLYENVYPGQMVDTFNDWCFDPARAVGDTGIVETEYGYHVMYFSGYGDNYRDYLVENTLRQNAYSDWYTQLVTAYTAQTSGWGMRFVTL